ncbi:MAG: DUF502 domain-containing protein [Bacteroidales bacterium]|nr:MAG: DUF502 domain-containing protein [Bacteroidales bacterium]
MKRIGGYFVQGLIYIAPLGITAYVVYLIYKTVDRLLETYIDPILPLNIPGINLLAVVLVIFLLGLIGQTIIARPVKSFLSKLLERAPLVKVIYSSVRDLLSAFVGKEKKFTNPVMVKVHHLSNLEKLGFLTQEDLTELGVKEKKVAVYFPHSYNFSGELFIVPSEYVRPLDISSAEIMKFIVSGGVTGL